MPTRPPASARPSNALTSAALRQQVWAANVGLPRAGLVTMHSGNASGIDRARRQILIKPSGVDYDRLRPQELVTVDLDGRVRAGKMKPSVDLPHHLYIYRHCPEVGGIIHTHSNYATAFALLAWLGLVPLLWAIRGVTPARPFCSASSAAWSSSPACSTG